MAIIATLAATGLAPAHAARPKAIAPPAGQEAAEELVGSLASACNRGDFIDFMNHFTPTHARRVRGRMEDIFIKHQPQMDIQKVTLLSESDDRITFGVRYAWHDKNSPEQVVASKVAARKVNDQWRLDGEVMKSIDRTPTEFRYAERSGGDVVNAGWNPFNPPADRINPALEHLRGDIGIQPGRGCANGRCAVR